MIHQFVLVLFCAGLTVSPGEARALEAPAQVKYEEPGAVDPRLYDVEDYLRALGGGSSDDDDDADAAEDASWGDAAPDVGSRSAEGEDPDSAERMRGDDYDAAELPYLNASPRRFSSIYSHMARG